MTQPAFYLDASACSGCKACQAACKDKHDLPVGVLWRRVYEVTGGGWTRASETWTSDVFAYHLSLSCHHCDRPICADVCPTQAMHKRADGIVVVDRDRCMGCQYCSWACPYDAPQYDPARGQMTKCDFCADNLAAGKPPACVAACPMRVLEMRERDDERSGRDERAASASVTPLPLASLTQPALIVKPHQASHRAGRLGNVEEVSGPRGSEDSLVAFTLLAQLAVGATWLQNLTQSVNTRAMASITAIMLVALLSSFLHLGQPRHAWRALANLRTSWLSREVLAATLFAGALLGVLTTGGRGLGLASAMGLALIISMAQVYRLRTVSEWNIQATTASFFATTLLLGGVLHGAFISADERWASGAMGLVVLRLAVGLREPRAVQLWRGGAMVALLITLFTPLGWWAVLAILATAEVMARRHFYATREPRSAWRFAAPAP